MRLMVPAACAAIAGCATVQAPNMETGTQQCAAQPAQALIGQQATRETGARALSLTGARSLRWGPPGAMWTMDLREDRVNVRYDDRSVITEITCG